MLARPLVLLLAFVAMTPFVMGDSSGYAPGEVLASSLDAGTAHVAWTPGMQVADSYRIYGIGPDGATVLLLDTSQSAHPAVSAATVEGGFSTYAVAGVHGGVPSQLVYALSCVRVGILPPHVSPQCT